MRSQPAPTYTFRPGRLLLAVLLAFGPAHAMAESVTVVSWGGSYTDACEEAYLKPFAAETGIEVTLDDYNGGLSQVRVVQGGSSYLSAGDRRLHFGLGSRTRIDTVEIRWPGSGTVDRLTGLALDRAYRIREGTGTAEPLERPQVRLGGG